jgi:hypothetical protein
MNFFCLLGAPALACAGNEWKFNTDMSVMTGQFTDSYVLKDQSGQGIRFVGEKNQDWGVAGGMHATRIDMQANVPAPRQHQDNWMLSGWMHTHSTSVPGRWTLQLDAYKTSNDAINSISGDVITLAPKITWAAFGQPLKLDWSYAHSKYKNTEPVYQISGSLAYGFNDRKDWIQVRSYFIDNLNPVLAMGKSRTKAVDIKLMHFLQPSSVWSPAGVALGLERGQKIYSLDVDKQFIYNLPMLNQGGENIAVHWNMSQQTTLHAMLSKNKYTAEQPFKHSFMLTSLAVQIAKSW